METGNTLYRKPFITAAVFLLLGTVSVFTGISLENSTGEMDYFALVAFGVFFIIISLVVFAVYGSMERKFKSVINDGKILDFMLNDDLYNDMAKITGDEIKKTNKGLLLIMLAFCIIFGLFSLFLEDGIILFAIFIGLGLFLTIMALIITKYRTSKIKKGSKRVILSKSAAYVGGEFHTWNLPGTALTGVKYVPRDEFKVKIGYIEISYGALTIPGPSEYTFVVPIPGEIEFRAQEIVSFLLK